MQCTQLQKIPPEIPKLKTSVKTDAMMSRDVVSNNSKSAVIDWQLWHQNGTRCPAGTVPIRRSEVHDVLRAKSLYDFGKKKRHGLPIARRVDAPDVVSGNGHEVSNFFYPVSNYLSFHVYFRLL